MLTLSLPIKELPQCTKCNDSCCSYCQRSLFYFILTLALILRFAPHWESLLLSAISPKRNLCAKLSYVFSSGKMDQCFSSIIEYPLCLNLVHMSKMNCNPYHTLLCLLNFVDLNPISPTFYFLGINQLLQLVNAYIDLVPVLVCN